MVELQSFITPFFDKGNPRDPNIYRPMSLACAMFKILDSIVKDQLVQYLVNKLLINTHQFNTHQHTLKIISKPLTC
jgi:hypothetical protein